MLRRLVPTLIGLALGFAVLLAGLISLEKVFRQERGDARQTVLQQRRVLEQYARSLLQQRLAATGRRADDEIRHALRDPLAAASHLLLVEAGTQRLPHLATYLPATATPARQWFAAITAGAPPPAPSDAGSPWRERTVLQREFLAALDQGTAPRIESTFRAILLHRSRFHVAPEIDLPSVLALLSLFHQRSSPAPELLRALLHDGLEADDGGEIVALSRLLLAHRGHFSRDDFLFLGEQYVRLAEASGVPYQTFLQRSREAAATPVDLPIEITEPSLVDFGRWLAEPTRDTTIRGFALDLPALLDAIGAEMQLGGLLQTVDSITPSTPLPRHLPLANLRLQVTSPRWQHQFDEIDNRYRLKAALVLLCAALAVALAILALAHQARRLRLLELRSEFVATVSHELRTPLAAVRLLAETVAKRAQGQALRDYPARIVKEIDRLHFLVENILSFNRLEKGRITPQFSSVSLEELLSQVRSEVELQANRPVRFDAPVSGVTLRADPELLHLLLLNLARNACLYNERDPVRITVDHRPLPTGGCRIRMVDNGRGIPENEWRKVFAEFYRPRHDSDAAGAGSPRAGARAGTGLGLALCRRIAKLHGGRLHIAASGPEGTTFHLDLP